MIDAYLTFWKKYIDFKSRSSRPDFWWVVLANIIISFVLLVFGFVGIFIGMDVDLANNTHITNMPIFVVGLVLIIAYLIYGIATIIPNISLSIRRIRDTGLSPWWYLLRLLTVTGSGVYYYNDIFASGLTATTPNMSVMTVSGLSSLASLALFIMYLLPTKATPETDVTVTEPEPAEIKATVQESTNNLEPTQLEQDQKDTTEK